MSPKLERREPNLPASQSFSDLPPGLFHAANFVLVIETLVHFG
jgi:hypothetical protein